MSELQVKTETVRGAGAGAQALTAEFAEALTQCDATAAGLLAESWNGPAAAMFESGWAEWHRGALEVQQALVGIARLLGESAGQYESTESAVTQVSSESSVTTGGAR